MLKESLLAAALTFPAWHGDKEPDEDRRARLETIVQAIDDAVALATCRDAAQAKAEDEPSASEDSRDEGAEPKGQESCKRLWRGDPRELGFLLLSQAFFETRLARHVHEGNCRTEIGECDSGRATSLWQLQAGYHLPIERWETLAGTDLASTRAAAFEAARALSRAKNFCRTLEGAISNYATGSRCRWKGARLRANFTRRLISRY